MKETGSINIAGALHSVSSSGIVVYSGDVYDARIGKSLRDINKLMLSNESITSNKIIIATSEDLSKFNTESSIYLITNDIDLLGATLSIPKNSTLEFEKGYIKNGTIICNNTEFVGSGKLFDTSAILQGSIIGDINPKMFGIYSEEDSTEYAALNFRSIKHSYDAAFNLDCNVAWDGISDITISPEEIIKIQTRYNDFKGCTINILTNTDIASVFLFVPKKWTSSITVDKSLLEGIDYSSIEELKTGFHLLYVKDEAPWIYRTDSADTGNKYRKDLILIYNGRAYNKPIYSYSSNQSNPTFMYSEQDIRPTVIKNLILKRKSESTIKCSAIVLSNIANVQIDNVTLWTGESDTLRNDTTLLIYNCANVYISDLNIYDVYEAPSGNVNEYAYGIHLDNIYNVTFNNINTTNRYWGIFGCNNINKITLNNCNVNIFDIHMYAKDITLNNCVISRNHVSLGCIYGNVAFNHCEFLNSDAIMYNESYHAYTQHTVLFNNCSITNNNKSAALLSISKPTVQDNTREELKDWYLPNLYVKNLRLQNLKYNYFYMYGVRINDYGFVNNNIVEITGIDNRGGYDVYLSHDVPYDGELIDTCYDNIRMIKQEEINNLFK